MTQFSQIELIYNQFSNLVSEIDILIEKEEYADAADKIEYKDNLIKQLSNAKKTVNFTNEEKLKMQSFENTIREKNNAMLANLNKLRTEIANEMNSTKKKIKLNSAYDQNISGQGAMIDFSE